MAAIHDLQSFIAILRENNQLLSIHDEISPETDIGAAACALHKFGTSSPAIYFDKIKGYTNARIATNIHGSWPNHALVLGMDKTADTQKQFFEPLPNSAWAARVRNEDFSFNSATKLGQQMVYY